MNGSCVRVASSLIWVAAVFGQTAPDRAAFEVASVKPLDPDSRARLSVRIDPARAEFVAISLTGLIARAYRVRAFQISGPDWMESARFDIVGKLPEGADTGTVPKMLQTLLAERFKLSLRRETKEFPVYSLIAGPGGPKLSAKPPNYDSAPAGDLRAMTMAEYAENLSLAMNRPVVDQTGLKGEFMVSMNAIRAAGFARIVQDARDNGAAGAGEAKWDFPGADVFSVVQSQGLKLEARKLPMDLLLVEHVERTPTAN